MEKGFFKLRQHNTTVRQEVSGGVHNFYDHGLHYLCPAGGDERSAVVAPALIIVGCFMLKNVSNINWDDFSEAIPAFLTILIMPLTFSITEGIAFGLISYTLLKTVQGRLKEVPLLVSIFSILFVLRYIFLF